MYKIEKISVNDLYRIAFDLIIVCMIVTYVLFNMIPNNGYKVNAETFELSNQIETKVVPVKQEVIVEELYSEEELYLLAKIAMAEAEGESLETKILIVCTILNRVESNQFPNTIEEVIFQNYNGVYQFSPISDGRWYNVEPNEECWEAVKIATNSNYDTSNGGLFFESCAGPSWHSENLELICQSDSMRFYN